MKAFIREDLEHLYSNTEFKKIPGKSPEIIFYNKYGEELERSDISKFTRSELNALMAKKGFTKREGFEHEDL